METATLKHPSLGEIKGKKSSDGVSRYSGIQYATLKDRFAPAVIKESDPNGSIDATEIGYFVSHYYPLLPKTMLIGYDLVLQHHRIQKDARMSTCSSSSHSLTQKFLNQTWTD